MIHNPNNPVWIDYVWQIVPVGARAAANPSAANNGNYYPTDTDENTFINAIGLTQAAAPVPPVTHLGIGMLIRQAQKDDLINFGSSVPGGVYYLETDGWDWDSVLADAGLKVVPDNEED